MCTWSRGVLVLKKWSIFTLIFMFQVRFSPHFFINIFSRFNPNFNSVKYFSLYWRVGLNYEQRLSLPRRSLRARCVLTRPGFDINSQRGGLTLSDAHTTNTPCLSNHFPPASPTIKHNSVFFTLPPVSACTPWRSRLGRERERETISLLIYLCLFPRLSG